jgi:hypothetical protein
MFFHAFIVNGHEKMHHGERRCFSDSFVFWLERSDTALVKERGYAELSSHEKQKRKIDFLIQ